jgi:prepilin-type N-terminal cleavage/methylation domain-containing protein
MRPPAARNQHGFTLFEMVISIVLMGILAVFGTSMVYDNMKTVVSVNSGARSLDRARYAMDRLARELREVKFTSGTYSFTSALGAGATSVAFVRTIAGTDVTVTLSRSGSNVALQYSLPTVTSSTLVNNVTSFSVDFYDADGTATTSTSDVRYVGLTLVVSDSASGQSASQRMRVALRNG